VDPVRNIDVGVPGRPKHGGVPRGDATVRVARGVIGPVGLRLHNPADEKLPSYLSNQESPYEIPSDLNRGARVETAGEGTEVHGVSGGCGPSPRSAGVS
jgi:hypothetical protein